MGVGGVPPVGRGRQVPGVRGEMDGWGEGGGPASVGGTGVGGWRADGQVGGKGVGRLGRGADTALGSLRFPWAEELRGAGRVPIGSRGNKITSWIEVISGAELRREEGPHDE